jgi:catechol 2,3-dioxygenase-like lactoylglutathione lyase family enzyme
MPDGTSVTELRLVVTVTDFNRALAFYKDALGLSERASYASHGGHVAILEAGRATLEITDAAHAAYIDDVEVGTRVAGHIRVAFEVADSREATRALERAGARVIAQPVPTPWNSVNSRLEAPGDLQLTLFSSDSAEQW